MSTGRTNPRESETIREKVEKPHIQKGENEESGIKPAAWERVTRV